MDAVIRTQYNIDPTTLELDEWTRLYADWQFVEKVKHENQKAATMAAISEILKAIFPDGIPNHTMDTGADR